MLEKTGDFELTLSDQLDDLKAETIGGYDVVLFYGSGGNFTDPAQEAGVDAFVRAGGGLVGVRSNRRSGSPVLADPARQVWTRKSADG